MSTSLLSGASSDLLTVDPTSRALRGTIYDDTGTESEAQPTGSYSVSFKITETINSFFNLAIFSMRNVSGPKTAYLRKINLIVDTHHVSFPAVTYVYHLCRTVGLSPSGGASLTPVKKRSGDPNSVVTNIQFVDTGLTWFFGTVESSFHSFGIPISGGAQNYSFPLDFGSSPFELASGEGLFIIVDAAGILGSTVSGSIDWDEK